MKKIIKKITSKTERGQAIILVALAMVGLVAMAGLVVDTGILLINYGKLKRGVDAAAVAAAQQYRVEGTDTGLDKAALANTAKNFLQLNENLGITNIIVNSCEDDVSDPDRPGLCNPDPDGNPDANRKLVRVTASANVGFGFLSVIGIKSTTLTASAVGEAATLDVVLIIDNSASMAWETDITGAGDPNPEAADEDDNPRTCNTDNSCQPMQAVKQVARDFIETLYFPYDRVAVITLTSNSKGTDDWDFARSPVEVLPLTSDEEDIKDALSSIKVFEPRDCDGNTTIPGNCLKVGSFSGSPMDCPYAIVSSPFDPSSCFSSNIGGALLKAQYSLTGSSGLVTQKLDAFWVVVAVLSGPPNATNIPRLGNGSIDPDHAAGYCPEYTWPLNPKCRDRDPWTRHNLSTNPAEYDADDYTRDQADALATLTTGDGVTIYTIGLGKQVQSLSTVDGTTPAAEGLFQYIAECAGENDSDDCYTPVATEKINHGQYFYSPTSQGLSDIFTSIANNIATKISQ